MRQLALALGRRAVQALLVALIVGTLCFVLVRVLPGDMAFRIAEGRYGYDRVGAAAAEAVRAELGLDRPAWVQFVDWLGLLLRLDLGASLVTGERVVDEIAHQLGHTVLLSLVAVALALLIGPPLGLLAALRPDGIADRAGLVAAAALRALPAFVLGVFLIEILALRLELLPAAGYHEQGNIVLPALTLALGLAAVSSRVARDAMVDVAASPQFLFARTKGLGPGLALARHGLRNVGVPVVAYLGVQLVTLVEGVVVVESLFAWPGIGHALVHAIIARDVPMVQGTALVMGLLFVSLNALIDVACVAIDPRRRTA
jgi:peptide/nickel transport system permease protein